MDIKKIIKEEAKRLFADSFYAEQQEYDEGVGDKYAQRQFGIPDPDQDYLKQTDAAVQQHSEMGKFVGNAVDGYNNRTELKNEPIYLNPQTLNNFDKNVRAVSDSQGNLYVAQHDGDFTHRAFDKVMNVNDVYGVNAGITWHRIGNTNSFGLADSSSKFPFGLGVHDEFKDEKLKNDNKENFKKNLEAVRNRFPQYKFYTFYYLSDPKDYDELTSDPDAVQEARHLNVPSDLNPYKSQDLEAGKPLYDNEVIRVYHGFYNFNEGLLVAKYGLSGKEMARRIYSYEAGNNPKGIFVSVSFDVVKRNFAGSGIIMEFSTKVSDLEAPVWVGGRSYYVQGEYTQSFKDDDDRQKQIVANREKHAQSEYPAIANSDRPDLAYALYDGSEKQALYVGDLNPDMIKAFWVNPKLIDERRIGGKWERLSRQEFLRKYYNEEKFKQVQKYGDGREITQYNDSFINKSNKAMRPNDDFSPEILKQYLDDMEYDYQEFVDTYIKNWDNQMLNSLFYPKQIEQIKKIYGVNDLLEQIEAGLSELL